MKKLAILLTLVVAPAYSETINISIPVNIEHLMPAVTQVKVDCRLYSANPGSWASPNGVVAEWMQKLSPDQSGKIQQVVQATINTNPNKPDPQYYQCGFQLGMVDGSWVNPDPSSSLEASRARQGTAFHPHEEGSIVQQLQMQKKQ